MAKICVIGAGVVGLSTACQLQEKYPNSQITVIADKFHTETLSNGAGGIFRVSPSVQGPEPDSVRNWALSSYKHFTRLLRSEDSAMAGIQEVSGYILFHQKSSEEKEAKFLKQFTPSVRSLTDDERRQFPGDFKGGIFFTTVVVDCNKYLPWLMARLTQMGGKIVAKSIKSISEISDQFDVIVNCCGLQAGELVGDVKIVPIRGQLFRLKAPWVKHFYYADMDTYIIPSTDTVALGGTRQYHSSNTKVDKHDSASIWERGCQFLPSLKHAEVQKEWVGLRPHRDPIRVEKEIVNTGSKHSKVVHNYGHGGYGISLSWGSAEEAVKLVESFISDDSPRSKL